MIFKTLVCQWKEKLIISLIVITFINSIKLGNNLRYRRQRLREIINFRQPSESTPAKHIIVHIPEKEVFMSTVHPAASLYEDVSNEKDIKKCFNNLNTILNNKNIELIIVRSALKLDR